LENFWTWVKFSFLRENNPYSSSGPNDNILVNRQIVDEKLRYGLKFYIGVIAMTIEHCVHENMRFEAEYLGNR